MKSYIADYSACRRGTLHTAGSPPPALDAMTRIPPGIPFASASHLAGRPLLQGQVSSTDTLAVVALDVLDRGIPSLPIPALVLRHARVGLLVRVPPAVCETPSCSLCGESRG